MVKRVVGLLALGVVAVVLGVAGYAWACTPQARIVALSPTAAPVHSALTVRGEALVPMAPVEVRWDGVEGAVIGSGTADASGGFSSVVNVPEAKPGVHVIVAVVRAPRSVYAARTTFEVTASAGDAVTTAADSARNPSRFDASERAAASEAESAVRTPLVVGAALLAVGGAALLSGFAVATQWRRRLPTG